MEQIFVVLKVDFVACDAFGLIVAFLLKKDVLIEVILNRQPMQRHTSDDDEPVNARWPR